MNPIGKDIAEMLQTDIDGLTIGTNLFVTALPNSPMDCISVYETSSQEPEVTQDKETIWNDAVQVLVRATSFITAHTRCQQVINSLHTFSNELWNDTFYMQIRMVNGPNSLMGQGEGKAHFLYSLNFRIQRNNTIDANPSITI